MKKQLIPVLLMLLLSACGFHLRGMGEVNRPKWLDNVAIIVKNNDKQLISALQSQLEGYSIRVNTDPTQAQYWLIIDQVVVQQQMVSVGASTIPRQYNLILTVAFTLATSKGRIIKLKSNVVATRQLTVNNDRILGSNQEESILVGEMKQDAVLQIINKLNH